MTVLNFVFESAELEIEQSAVRSPEGSASVQSRTRFPRRSKRWIVASDSATESDVAEIEARHDETKGGAGSFQWTTPDGVEIDCRFVGEFEASSDNGIDYAVRATIEALWPWS